MSRGTFLTGIAVANSMVGASLIIFPTNFLRYGIIENIIFVIIMAFIMALTCSIYANYIQPNNKNTILFIRMFLGPKFSSIFSLMTTIILFFYSGVFYLLATDILYDLVAFFSQSFLSFKSQWFKIICLPLFICLSFFKNLNIVLKISPIAMTTLVISTLIIIGSVSENAHNLNPQVIKFRLPQFSTILTIASLNGFAFLCHPTVGAIVMQNKNFHHNTYTIYIGYTISAILYLLVGILGSLAIYDKPHTKSNNTMDYFEGQWQSPAIGSLNILYFLCIFPIFPYVSKLQLIQLLPEKPQTNLIVTIVWTIVWSGVNVAFVWFQTDPNTVLSFLGAVVCWYMAYFIPFAITIKLGKQIYQQTYNISSIENSLNQQESTQNRKDKNSQQTNNIINKQTQSQNQQTFLNCINEQQLKQYQLNDKKYKIKYQSVSLFWKIVYIIILIIGSILMVAKIIDIIENLV